MAKQLKLFNGHVFHDGKQVPAYVAAYSQKDVVAALAEHGVWEQISHVRSHWSKGQWGIQMDGVPPERGVWVANRDGVTKLEPVAIRPSITVEPKYLGESRDCRTNKLGVDCPYCGKSITPVTTRLRTQHFDCGNCGANAVADWNEPVVVFTKDV